MNAIYNFNNKGVNFMQDLTTLVVHMNTGEYIFLQLSENECKRFLCWYNDSTDKNNVYTIENKYIQKNSISIIEKIEDNEHFNIKKFFPCVYPFFKLKSFSKYIAFSIIVSIIASLFYHDVVLKNLTGYTFIHTFEQSMYDFGVGLIVVMIADLFSQILYSIFHVETIEEKYSDDLKWKKRKLTRIFSHSAIGYSIVISAILLLYFNVLIPEFCSLANVFLK